MKKIKQRFINLQKYFLRYNSKCQQWKDGPVEQRHLNDHLCVSILVLLIISFFFVGLYSVYNYDNMLMAHTNYNSKKYIDYDQDDDDDQYQYPRQFLQTLSYYKFQIISYVLLSNILSILYIYFLKVSSKLVIYLMIAISTMFFLIIEYGQIISKWEYDPIIPLVLGILIIIYAILMICYRNQIKIGIVLIKIAGTFMLQRKVIFVAILIKAALTFILSMYWIYVFLCIFSSYFLSYLFDQQATKQEILMSYWSIMFGFFSLLLYYFSVFNIAVIFSYWYYDIDQKFPLSTSWKWIMKYSIGSLTFAALLVTFTKFLCSVLDSNKKYTKNIPALICIEFLKCLFSQAASLLQVFNHNAVICMALTGQSFVGSAKTTLGIVGQEFAVISIISKLLYIWGFVVSVLGPTILAYFISGETPMESDYICWIVFYFSSLISGLILSILNQSLACVIFFYCMDKRFRDLGLPTHKMPPMIKKSLQKTQYELFDEYIILRD